MTEVKIYTTATCVYCRAEKQFLDAHGVKYQELHADQDQETADELFKLSGQYAVPFTVIELEGGKIEHVLGFDQPKLTKVLSLH